MAAKIINTPGTTPIDAITQIARELEQVALDAGYRIAVFYGSTTWDDHDNRRCLDVMVSRISGATVVATGKPVTPDQEKTLGYLIADYVWSNRKRLRLNWQIWRGRIRRAISNNRLLKPINIWAVYFRPTTHFDHVHIEVAAGAYVAPPASPTTPPVEGAYVPPATVAGDVFLDKLVLGQARSASVWRMQKALQALGFPVIATGTWDEQTTAAVKAWQRSIGDQVTGDVGPKQTAKLFRDAKISVSIEAKS